MARASRFSRYCLFLAAVAILSAVGCGSGGGSSASTTKIRFVNASLSSSITTVNVLIDGTTVATALANGGGATAYLSVASGARHIQIQDPNTSTNLIDTTPTISGNTTYIFKDFITGTNTPLILSDDNTAPASGNFKVRVVNVAPQLNSGVDVYVQPSTITTLNGLTATFGGVLYPVASNYYTNTAGSWEVVFTPPGSQGILAGGNAITLAAGQVETVLILEDINGPNYTEVALTAVQ